jgi:hypothetical protein
VSHTSTLIDLSHSTTFFTSYQLLKTLNERGLYAVGTVTGSRKGLPDILKRNDRR